MRRMFVASVLSLAPGCFTAQYGAGNALPERPSIDGVRVVIVPPADGADDQPRTYLGSGKQTAEALAVALAKRGAIAEVDAPSAAANPYAFYTNSLARPAAAGGYRVTPKIEHWANRVTEWSGKSDQVSIRLLVTDEAGKTIDDRLVTAKSKWWTLGGDHPQEMLVDLFVKWTDAVFVTTPQR